MERITTKGRIVSIGSSRGVLLPELLIEHSGVGTEVHLDAEPGRIVIRTAPPPRPRAGWAEAARRMHFHGDDVLLGCPGVTRFDEEEPEWR
jgi:hypothetical protein